MKKYSAYKDSGINWIGRFPSDWNIKKLKYIMRNFDGKRVPLNSEQRSEMQGEYPYYGSNGIVDQVNDYLFDGEFIILGEDGAPFFEAYKDVAFLVRGRFWVNNHAHILKANSNCNHRFLTYSLNRVDYRRHITGSTRDKLTQDDMSSIELPIANQYEQEAIANYLDRKIAQIDDLIIKKERMIELLKEDRAAVINQAVTKGLNSNIEMKDSGIEWLGKIPKHWKVKKLKFIALLKSGEGITADLIKDEDRYPVFGGNGLRGYTSAFTHDGSFILIGRQGALCGNINYTIGKFWASEHAVVVTISKGNDVAWLGELLRVMNLNQYSQSAAQPGLAVDNIQNFLIPVPPNKEQEEIAVFLNGKIKQNDAQVIQENKSIQLLKEYRTALISEVVTGKIDVRN